MTAAVLTFQPRKRAVPEPRYYVVRSGGFDSMSCWGSLEQAAIAADDLAEQFPDDRIAILHPVSVYGPQS
jgi:hypothetical protein